MSNVLLKFAEALKSRLNGQADALPMNEGRCWPSVARQADIPEDAIGQAAAEALGADYCDDLSRHPVSHEYMGIVPIGYARRHCMVGLATGNGRMKVAVAELGQLGQLESLAKILDKPVDPVFAPRDEILRTISAAYQQQTGQAQRIIEELDDGQDVMRRIEGAGAEDLLDVASRAPVIKMVNLVLFEAVKRHASDVHVQPYEDRLQVRMRVDGVLHDVFQPPKSLQSEIISRIKVMGGMNIAERRVALDGRATVEVGDRIVDLRISTLPTSFGERAVIRLLDKSARLYTLDELGMSPSLLESFRNVIHCDHGIVLVTGPTGSGKSTTLYSALQEINSDSLNILTLEDPIEYRLEGISQTQVNDKKGMTFAGGLRHVLRQDPDIIMVGEIRDEETARMAIQSALTGHLVFSTLHTNDSAGAVARLLDLGVEPYLVASSLLGVVAQRLIRCICPECRAPYIPTDADLRRWDIGRDQLPAQLFVGGGCDECLGTGFRRRRGIFEFLEMSEPIRDDILHRAKASSIKAHAIKAGAVTLRLDGIEKVRNGITTMDEVMRVSGRDEF